MASKVGGSFTIDGILAVVDYVRIFDVDGRSGCSGRIELTLLSTVYKTQVIHAGRLMPESRTDLSVEDIDCPQVADHRRMNPARMWW